MAPEKEHNIEKARTPLDKQQLHTLALQASGEYLMSHIAGVMEMVQDQREEHSEPRLDETMLIAIEAQVKDIAEKITQQAKDNS
ncbi:hypothetical protein KSC_084600 [Ktedonobacter sp. SOSP1-52]|uniref:hypothetical protein n=1 Tax=Ktedonobacter sp. SOSP1-52 TaxID=2778366 RepID=UPI001915CBF8|nr:hypothetical protein [Ktedonobacter sp. SOSP1-52]GHO69568.1 hypothetical protein KSC_084600 [Ktedonobacter sp. SOSP1-52]